MISRGKVGTEHATYRVGSKAADSKGNRAKEKGNEKSICGGRIKVPGKKGVPLGMQDSPRRGWLDGV